MYQDSLKIIVETPNDTVSLKFIQWFVTTAKCQEILRNYDTENDGI